MGNREYPFGTCCMRLIIPCISTITSPHSSSDFLPSLSHSFHSHKSTHQKNLFWTILSDWYRWYLLRESELLFYCFISTSRIWFSKKKKPEFIYYYSQYMCKELGIGITKFGLLSWFSPSSRSVVVTFFFFFFFLLWEMILPIKSDYIGSRPLLGPY